MRSHPRVERPSIRDCRVVDLPRIFDSRGNLTPVHGGQEIPFEIRRVFYLYDIPGGESRGAHAHRSCEQFIISVLGSFEVQVDDGQRRDVIQLNRSFRGVYIPPMIWASEVNFSSGSICLVLASELYDESDYIRDYDDFLREVRAGEHPFS